MITKILMMSLVTVIGCASSAYAMQSPEMEQLRIEFLDVVRGIPKSRMSAEDKELARLHTLLVMSSMNSEQRDNLKSNGSELADALVAWKARMDAKAKPPVHSDDPLEEKNAGNNNLIEDQQPEQPSEAFVQSEKRIRVVNSIERVQEVRKKFIKDAADILSGKIDYEADDETKVIIDLALDLNIAELSDDQRACLQCQMDQRIADECIKKLGQQSAEDFQRSFPLVTPEELLRLKQIKSECVARLQQQVDDAAAQLGLPKLQSAPIDPNKTPNLPLPKDPTFVEKTKTFVSNHKLMIGGIAAAAIGVILYMRNLADELDAASRVNAVNN